MKSRLLWLTTGTGLIVVVLFLATMTAGTAYTSTSDSCVNCHEMSTQYMSWKRSTHESISCMACHSGVGIKGYIGAKVGGVRKMYKHATNTIEVEEIRADVVDEVCLNCHYTSKDKTYVYNKVLKEDPLLVPTKMHKDHFQEEDISCLTCHKGMVHGSISGDVKITKEGCVDCHNKKKIYSDLEKYFK